MNEFFKGSDYFAAIAENSLSVGINDEVFFKLNPVSAVDSREEKDEEICLAQPVIEKSGSDLTVIWAAKSTLWNKKEYVFHLKPEMISYCVRVYGKGAVDGIDYFTGDRKCRFYGSGYDTADYFAPLGLGNAASPNRIFTMAEETHLGILGGYSPTPLAFSFRMAGVVERILLGIAALPGNASFDGLTYKSIRFAPDISRFCLHAGFGGYQNIDGYWESPAVICLTAGSDIEALRRYAQWHYDQGLPRAVTDEIPLWWNGPFFCGWKEQAVTPGIKTTEDAASQDCYLRMSDTLDERGLKPSAIIIDDKWQKEYGAALPDENKWRNMRAFVDLQHRKRRHVVLWFMSWNAEGLEKDECILSESGQKLSCDPTSPAYRARVRNIMHTLLSDDDGCMNADGFKVDFADCVPLEKDMRIYEKGIYGIALLNRFMELIYSEAKRVKPDALINTSCCHPFFAAYTDQARLHDNYFALRDSVRIMSERAELFDAMMPGISIDTDAGSCGSRRDFMRYARECVNIGVPDIYILNPIEDCALTSDDWDEIRAVWENYRQSKKL